MAVNSVTKLRSPLGGPTQGYLALNGCTNYGGHTFVSVESGACSSEATGISSGVVGLIESAARDRGLVLSAAEVMQIVRATADDVDFATPNAVDPANDFGVSTGGLLDTVRYHSTPGWDATYGYGRLNAYAAVRAVQNGRIPPTADIATPSWFSVQGATGSLVVDGTVSAPRADSFDYRVEWASGVQPPDAPAQDSWHVVARGSGQGSYSGQLGTLDLASIARALPGGGRGAPATRDGRPDEERFAVRLRVVVIAHGGASDALDGVDQRQIFVHDDPAVVAGFPRSISGAGTASPVFAQVDGSGPKELVLGTDDGAVHVMRSDGSELPGFPVHTAPPQWWPSASPTAAADHIAAPGSGIPVGGPVVADLDGDGKVEIVVTTTDGHVYVWGSDGRLRPGFPRAVDPRFSLDTPGPHDQYNRTKPGFFASPAVGDLDGDGTLEIVAAGADRHVYAWHADGTTVAGFPVLVVDPSKVQAVDPATHAVTFRSDSGVREGGELVVTPALADIDGDGHPEIVVGAQEEYAEPLDVGDGTDVQALLGAVGEPGNARLYAISPRGTLATNPRSAVQPDAQAYLPGWPARLGMLTVEALPTIGDGVTAQVAVGDVSSSNRGPEIVAAAADGPLYVLDSHGRSVFGQVNGADIPLAWSAGLDGSSRSRFGANANTNDLIASIALFGGPALGHLGSHGTLDPTAPTAGLSRVLDIQASDFQPPADDTLSAWSGTTGNTMRGMPHTTSDMAFFVTPAVADLTGDGLDETIAGDGVYLLTAVDAAGRAPSGFPKLTGGWVVGTPGLGDWDGDGKLELAVVRRDGVLDVWRTDAAASQQGWLRFGGNDRNSGSVGR